MTDQSEEWARADHTPSTLSHDFAFKTLAGELACSGP